MKRLNITEDQLRVCWKIWINDKSLSSALRFGQYLYNKYGREPWPLLFHETDSAKVFDLMYKN